MSFKRRYSNFLDGNVQVFEPTPILIGNLQTNDTVSKDIWFKVPTPDTRVGVKIAVYGVPSVASATVPAVIPFDVTVGGLIAYSLWLHSRETDEGSGLEIPLVNLLGTFGTGQVIPFDVGLMGISYDAQGGQDFVWGRWSAAVTESEGTAVGVSWYLQTRYSPLVTMCDAEWADIAGQFAPQIVGNPLEMPPST